MLYAKKEEKKQIEQRYVIYLNIHMRYYVM